MANIMVVDDSSLARRMLKPILLGAGHTVVCEATNGAEAVQCYPEYLPDVVMMDITMPGEDGIAAAKKIRADFPDARIIMVTAMADDRHVMEAVASGAAQYVIKPYKREKVLSALAQVLGG